MGGNIFKDHASPILRENIRPTLKKYIQNLQRIFPKKAHVFNNFYPVGSVGKKEISGDLSKLSNITKLAKSITEVWGGVDIMINNAATISPMSMLGNLDIIELEKSMNNKIVNEKHLRGRTLFKEDISLWMGLILQNQIPDGYNEWRVISCLHWERGIEILMRKSLENGDWIRTIHSCLPSSG